MDFENKMLKSYKSSNSWKVLSHTREVRSAEKELIDLIEKYIEAQGLIRTETGKTIKAIESPDDTIERKLSEFTHERYEYVWKFFEGQGERTSVSFELYAPTYVKKMCIGALLFGAISLSYALSVMFLPQVYAINQILFVLIGILCLVFPSYILEIVISKRAKQYWRNIENLGVKNRIVREQEPANDFLYNFVVLVFIGFFGTLGVTYLYHRMGNTGFLNLKFVLALLTFAGLIGLVFSIWYLSNAIDGFDRFSQPSILGMVSQLSFIVPLLSLFTGVSTTQMIGKNLGIQGSTYNHILVFFNLGLWLLVPWVMIFIFLHFLTKVEAEDIIKPSYKVEHPGSYQSSSLSRGGKALIVSWFVITLTSLLAVPLFLLLTLDFKLSAIMNLVRLTNLPVFVLWLYISSFFVLPIAILSCLFFENLKENRIKRKLLQNGDDISLDSEEQEKLDKLEELVENTFLGDRRFGIFKNIAIVVSNRINSYEISALTGGVIRRTGYVLLSRKYLREFSYSELEALLLHELHHLKEDNLLLLGARILSKITLFGSGLLAAALDLPVREYKADRYASSEVGRETVIHTLKKVENKKRMASLASVLQNSLGVLEFSGSPQTDSENLTGFRKVYRYLFGPYIPMYNHPTLQERIDYLQSTGGQ